MADLVRFNFTGMDELMRQMADIPPRTAQRLVRGTVATGASVIRQEAIRRAPVWQGEQADHQSPPGTLKASIYQTRLSDECTPTVEVWKVDVRRGSKGQAGAKGYKAGAFYAAWVEFGHYARVSKSVGKTRNQRREHAKANALWVPAHPYMRPAFEVSKNAALTAMQDYFRDNLALVVGVANIIKERS